MNAMNAINSAVTPMPHTQNQLSPQLSLLGVRENLIM